MRPQIYIRATLTLLLAGAAAFAVPSASAQSLVEMYRSARFRMQAQQLMERNGHRVTPLPVERLPYVTDSVRRQMESFFPSPQPVFVEEPSIQIERWSLTPRLAGGWFEEKFKDSRWSYLGNSEIIAYDTTFTREIRARMEAHFGSPTRTIADWSDADGRPTEYIQFQYWFVFNDSIPLIVMDPNGPFDRGVVVATGQEYRNDLQELKDALLGPLIESNRRAPYVDYYYLEEQNTWFLTGFDGVRFFHDRISRPNLQMRRPFIDTVRGR